MKKIGLLAVLALIGVVAYFVLYSKKNKPHGEEVKLQAETVSKHSAGFNSSVKEVLTNYFSLSEAFVTWDTANISARASSLQASMSGLKLDEIKNDTVIHDTAKDYMASLGTELQQLKGEKDITSARHSFNTFSQHFYDLLRTIRYDGGTVFLQECPMAFDDNEPGLWLSDKAAIRNPYLGLHHPKYKSGMLECGENKDSLHFTGQTQN
jgi:hypothetical protein